MLPSGTIEARVELEDGERERGGGRVPHWSSRGRGVLCGSFSVPHMRNLYVAERKDSVSVSSRFDLESMFQNNEIVRIPIINVGIPMITVGTERDYCARLPAALRLSCGSCCRAAG